MKTITVPRKIKSKIIRETLTFTTDTYTLDISEMLQVLTAFISLNDHSSKFENENIVLKEEVERLVFYSQKSESR